MKKEIPIFLKIALLTAGIFFFPVLQQNAFANAETHAFLENNYIYDKNFLATQISAASAESPYLSGETVTPEALGLFRALERQFAVQSLTELDGHYEQVRQDLFARFPKPDAQRLFEYYRRYLDCQIIVVNDSRFETTSLEPKELLLQLYQIQSFRREKLGRETADALFGQEVKEHEYLLRRLIVIGDSGLYGKEKELKLHKLKSDMWGKMAVSLGEDQEPYNLYELKLQLYARDLAEMDENQRKRAIEDFRKYFFSPEQVERLRKADAEVAAEDENLKRYRAEEKKILTASGLSRKQRDQAIQALQDRYFGAEADAFRRREAIQKEPEK